MRIVLWHGYLLGGTGSNVYTRALAREWTRAGHDVTVVCQERFPGRYDIGSAEVVVPNLPGGLLPVFVLDDYPGLEARLLQDFRPEERERYVAANAAAVRELPAPELLFVNHVLMGAAVGAAVGGRYRLKAHGSELEYSIRGRPELARWAHSCLVSAEATVVGSEHIRAVLEEVVGPVSPVLSIPPGVDIDEFVPAERGVSLLRLLDEARRDPANPGNANERLPDADNAQRLARFFERDEPTLLYFGKLIENKGVQLLLEGSCHARRARRDRRLRRLPDRARAARRATAGGQGALHRCARAPSSRPPASACRRRRGAVDLPRGVRHGRRRGGRLRLSSARGTPFGSR